MDERQTIAMQEQLQRLLAGDLDERDTQAVLTAVAQDDQARAELRRTLVLRDRAREALGSDPSADVAAGSLEQTLQKLRAPGPRGRDTQARPAFRRGRWTRQVPWLACAAAVVALAGCVWMTVLARRDTQAVRDEIAQLRIEVRVPGPGQEELSHLRQVWQEVAQDGDHARPWVFLSSGAGEFGYMPAEAGSAHENRPLLLRCVIADDAGRPMKQMGLILPGRQALTLDVREAGRLRGRPVRVGVAASGTSAVFDLKVGVDSTDAVGLRAVVPVGREAIEVGQFRLGSEKARVFLQVMPMQAEPA